MDQCIIYRTRPTAEREGDMFKRLAVVDDWYGPQGAYDAITQGIYNDSLEDGDIISVIRQRDGEPQGQFRVKIGGIQVERVEF